MTPDQVVDEYGDKATKLKISLAAGEGGEMALIEGESDDLKFLGHLLLAVAEGGDRGFHLDPNGAGSAHFDPEAKLGVYVLRKGGP